MEEKKIKIYTSYFAKMKYLPKNIMPIVISKSAPDIINIGYIPMEELAPSWDILRAYKLTGDQEEYKRMYYNNILSKLSAKALVKELEMVCWGDDREGVALICYESPEKFCHRHLVAEWIEKETGYKVEEYKY